MSAIDDLRALRNAAGVEPLGPGRYAVELSQYYTAVDHPNGGYLQCVLGNGALAAASEQGAHQLHVSAITTNFIGAPALGAAELRTEVRRVGRGVSFVHVTLVQDAVVTTESLVTLGTLHEDSEARYMDASPPKLAPLEQCHESLDSEEVNIRRVVDLRVDPSSERWWEGEVSERGEVRGWMRLNDGDGVWSAWSLLFASDAIPPATFPLGSSGWVPTLQLTTYVRRIPTSEWLRFRQWCVVIADGLVDERCELFDDRDELVASASQIAMVRFPGHH
jgi:acyl-CoA thioesterase